MPSTQSKRKAEEECRQKKRWRKTEIKDDHVKKQLCKPKRYVSKFENLLNKQTKKNSLTNTCSSGAIIGTRFLSVPEDLQSWVATDTIFAACVAVSCAVNLMGNKTIPLLKGALQYRVQKATLKWTKLNELHYAIPWPERRCLSDVWQLTRTQVLAVYNGHT